MIFSFLSGNKGKHTANLTIHCYAGSTSEIYAINNSIPYELIVDTVVVLGDVNGDGVADNADLAVITLLLKGGSDVDAVYPDVNGDESTDNADLAVLNFILKGGDFS